jgi:hypothetical protein
MSDECPLQRLFYKESALPGGFFMQKPCITIIIPLALIACFASAHGGISFTFGGNAGAYTLPGEVKGYIDGSASTNSRFIWAESGTDQYGYITQTYKYKHPFALRTLPNTGVNFGIAYSFPSRIGVFFEVCWAFSVFDKETGQCVPDTLPGNQNATIPHDYQIRSIESTDRLYLKSFQYGIGLSYSVPIKKRLRLIFAGSFGSAHYSQYFRVETTSITTGYYQNDGHLVYTGTDNRGSFEVFGIRYSANCFKPAVAAEWNLKSPLSVRFGLSYPISLIEQGVYFTGNDSYDYYSSTYYPSKRFWAGNVSFDAGVRISLGKGGNR